MNISRQPARSATAVMVCYGLIGFQYIGSVVTRDALFLSSMDAAARPLMIGMSGGLWLVLAAMNFHFRRQSLTLVVPVAFGISAVLMLIDFAVVGSQPSMASMAFFLQTNALGPFLGSLFWLVTSNQSDPRSARAGFGQILGAGTLGGLMGAIAAGQLPSWFGIGAMLPVLAILNLMAGSLLWHMARLPARNEDALPDETVHDEVKHLLQLDYVPVIAGVLLLGSASTAFVEHLVSVKAQLDLNAAALPAFFSTYHIVVTLAGLVIQTTLAKRAINTLGVGALMSSSSLVLMAGSLGAWAFPSLVAVTAAYGLGSVVHDSFFKKAYELFFTSVSPRERRTIKPVTDGLPIRMGAAAGAGLIATLTVLAPAYLYPGLLLATAVCASGAVLLARRMNALYVAALERALLDRAVEVDLSNVPDISTLPVLMRTARVPPAGSISDSVATLRALPSTADPEVNEILRLRSRDRDAVTAVLRSDKGPSGALIAHIIPLLAWDDVAQDAVRALRKVAEERIGEIADALTDPNQPFAVRRRLARVFSACTSQRAIDGAVLGLDDHRFEVRFQCARSLAAILAKNPRVRIDGGRVFDSVRRELAVSRPVWKSRQMLDLLDRDGQQVFVDDFVRDRAGQSLAHVFTLLSLVLPSDPLRIAYHALHTDDRNLHGTALEYLDGVLPTEIGVLLRDVLEEEPRPRSHSAASREAVLADLMNSNEAVTRMLEQMRRRSSVNGIAPADKGNDGR